MDKIEDITMFGIILKSAIVQGSAAVARPIMPRAPADIHFVLLINPHKYMSGKDMILMTNAISTNKNIAPKIAVIIMPIQPNVIVHFVI